MRITDTTIRFIASVLCLLSLAPHNAAAAPQSRHMHVMRHGHTKKPRAVRSASVQLRDPAPCPGDPAATEIRTPADLAAIGQNISMLNNSEVIGGNYKLCNPITLPTNFPYQIGVANDANGYPTIHRSFVGTLNLNGFAITTHAVDAQNPSPEGHPAIFYALLNSTISNVNLVVAANNNGITNGSSLLATYIARSVVDGVKISGTVQPVPNAETITSNTQSLLANRLWYSEVHNIDINAKMLTNSATYYISSIANSCINSKVVGGRLNFSAKPMHEGARTTASVGGIFNRVGDIGLNYDPATALCEISGVRGSVDLQFPKGNVAGLVGSASHSKLKISDIALTRTTLQIADTSSDSYTAAAGFVGGGFANISVERSTFQGNIKAYESGGVIADSYGGFPITVKDMQIVDTLLTGRFVGGIAGYSGAYITMENVAASNLNILPMGNEAYSLAGLVAVNEESQGTLINNAFFSGTIGGSDIRYLNRAPILGSGSCYDNYSTCIRGTGIYYNSDLFPDALYFPNPVGLTTQQMQTSQAYQGFDFTNKWTAPSATCMPQPLAAPHYIRADFTNNGNVDVGDLFAFLTAYFSGSSSADYSNNGELSMEDLMNFLESYFSQQDC